MENQDWAAHYREVRARISAPSSLPRKQAVCHIPPKPKVETKDAATKRRMSELMYGLPQCSDDLRFSIQQILIAYDTPWLGIIGRSRFHSRQPPRRAITWLLHLRGWSTPQIGRFIGRDHTTVVHSLQQVNSFYVRPAKTRGEAFWL